LKKCAHGKYIITSIVILALVTFICISLYCYHLGAGLYGMAMVKKSWPLNSKHKRNEWWGVGKVKVKWWDEYYFWLEWNGLGLVYLFALLLDDGYMGLVPQVMSVHRYLSSSEVYTWRESVFLLHFQGGSVIV